VEARTRGSMPCNVSQTDTKYSLSPIYVLNHSSQVCPFPQAIILTTDELDSFMYQTVGHDAIHIQAECLSIPLYREYITGESIDQTLNYTITTNDETEDLFRLLAHVKALHPEIQGVSVGAILSTYQRARVENVCSRLGLTCLAYLWQRDQKELLSEMIQAGLTAVIIKVAAIGINSSVQRLTIGLKSLHLGKTLGEMQPTLLKLVYLSLSFLILE
jgi:diphthine-ammonia ligase